MTLRVPRRAGRCQRAAFLFGFALCAARFAQCAAVSPVANEDEFLMSALWDQYRSLPGKEESRIGVALGGGGARGLAHIGILKVFQEEGVPIQRLSGSSVGALIGALYAAGVQTSQLESMAKDVGWSSLTNYSNMSLIRLLFSEKLLSNERMEEYVRIHIGDKRFEDLEIPFSCVATDLQTGEAVVFREGPVALAARASATIPGLFQPVVFRHRYLVDGGLVDNVPTDLLSAMDTDVVVAVDVAADFSSFEPKGVLNTMTQAIYIQGALLSHENLARADLVIRPEMGDISPIDITRSSECIDAGTRAARLSMNRLKQLLIDRSLVHLWKPRRGKSL